MNRSDLLPRRLSALRRLQGLALAVLCLLVGAIDPAAAQSGREFWIRNGVDLPGFDYHRFEIPPAGGIAGDLVASRCETACKGDARCKAWTAVKPGIQARSGVCYLKTSARIPQVVNGCCTSGALQGIALSSTGRPLPSTGRPAGSSSRLVDYARAALGKCVDRDLRVRGEPCPTLPVGAIGHGECTDLVNGALVSAGHQKVNGYVWGTRVGDNTTANKASFLPGDIIQLNMARLAQGGFHWETTAQHTAIIEANANGVLTVLEQNTNSRRYVTRGTLNLNWTLERGSYVVYRR